MKSNLDYVVCIPEDANKDETCPITSFAFDLDSVEDKSLYEKVKIGEAHTDNFFFSRKVMQHGIEQVHISPD